MTVVLQLAAGLAWGYLAVTLAESFLHRHFKHAGSRMRRTWRRLGRLGAAMRASHYVHHVVHHTRTYRLDYVTQFRDRRDRDRVDAELERRGAEHIRDERYGLTMGWRGVATYVGPLLPIAALTYLTCGLWVFVGAVLPMAAFPMVSVFIHPWLHVPLARARAEASRPIAWLLDSAYMRFVARSHYIHHHYPDCNFNLVPGGDFILGVYRRPSAEDLKAMRRLGLPVSHDPTDP